MSTSEEVIGKARSYRDFVSVLRAFFEEQQISRDMIGYHCSFTGGHAAKLLSPIPLKHFGPTTLTLLLQQCGLEIWIVKRPDEAFDDLPKRKRVGGAAKSI